VTTERTSARPDNRHPSKSEQRVDVFRGLLAETETEAAQACAAHQAEAIATERRRLGNGDMDLAYEAGREDGESGERARIKAAVEGLDGLEYGAGNVHYLNSDFCDRMSVLRIVDGAE
jgi:hypothetical protein